MGIILGILLVPVVFLIIRKANMVTTKKKTRVMLNLLLVLMAVLFYTLCRVVRAEPFVFEQHYSAAYMFFSGKFLLEYIELFVFAPFLWFIVMHFGRILFRPLRIHKNALIRKSEDYIYYRGDLDKVSPAIIRFTSTLEIDLRKSISATLLKLKLTGYIQEKNGSYICTDKDTSDLLKSEIMVFNLVRYGHFEKGEYRKVIEEEALKSKYLTKKRGGIFARVLGIIIAICIPFAIFDFSVQFDKYVFDNYKLVPDPDGNTYWSFEREEDIEKLYYEVEDEDDFYHETGYYGEFYNYGKISADKMQYSTVRKAFYMRLLDVFLIAMVFVSAALVIYWVIEQLVYINKNYKRTRKGKALLSKAYALKNYLKDYSLIKDRTEQELELWQYYLVYAVALDVNVKIEDEVIEKYIKSIV